MIICCPGASVTSHSHDNLLSWGNIAPGKLHCPGASSRLSVSQLRACSHEPGTVNYPRVMNAPGQALPHIHMMICRPGATLPWVNFIVSGQVQRHLITTKLSEFLQFLHKLLQGMNFKHVYLFLVLSGTVYWEFYSRH